MGMKSTWFLLMLRDFLFTSLVDKVLFIQLAEQSGPLLDPEIWREVCRKIDGHYEVGWMPCWTRKAGLVDKDEPATGNAKHDGPIKLPSRITQNSVHARGLFKKNNNNNNNQPNKQTARILYMSDPRSFNWYKYVEVLRYKSPICTHNSLLSNSIFASRT